MIIGTTLLGSSDPYYSEWTASDGGAATFAVVALNLASKTDLDVAVYTKDRGDADPTTAAGTFTTIATTGPESLRVTGLKQLVRLEFIVGGTGDNAVRFAHVDVPAPQWERD